jgi:citrate synthase
MEEVQAFRADLRERGKLTNDLIRFIMTLNSQSASIAQLSQLILFSQSNSHLLNRRKEGTIDADDIWEYYLEDVLDIMALLPQIAALIYRHKYHVPLLFRTVSH